jgi:hypothetical protein
MVFEMWIMIRQNIIKIWILPSLVCSRRVTYLTLYELSPCFPSIFNFTYIMQNAGLYCINFLHKFLRSYVRFCWITANKTLYYHHCHFYYPNLTLAFHTCQNIFETLLRMQSICSLSYKISCLVCQIQTFNLPFFQIM